MAIARYDVRQDGLTQSVLGSWLKCRRFATLSIKEGWTPIKPKTTFIFGDLTHAILEYIYSKKYFNRPPTQEELQLIISIEIKKWKKQHEFSIDETFEEALEFNAAKLEAVLPEYFKYWFKKDFQKTKWLGLEKEFMFKINGIPIRGKRDGEYEEHKDIFLFETKTKSQIDERTLYEVLPIDLQTNLYNYSIFREYGKWPKGVTYNIIRNPGNKLHKNEFLKDYTKRLRSDIQKNPKHYFIRYFIYRPIKELERFKEELRIIVNDFVKWHDGLIPDYRNTNSCTSKYGTCSMINICSMGKYSLHKKRTKIYSELSYTREA